MGQETQPGGWCGCTETGGGAACSVLISAGVTVSEVAGTDICHVTWLSSVSVPLVFAGNFSRVLPSFMDMDMDNSADL